MNRRLPSVLFGLSIAGSIAGALAAQEQAPAAPNPKTPQHERLAVFVGAWRTETKVEAVPGVEGMEKAAEMAASNTPNCCATACG